MTTSATPKWLEVIDRYKFEHTGEALLYCNPINTLVQYNSKMDKSPEYLYSMLPGIMYLFDQKPIAFGFTAYIGHDEVEAGYNSLKSNIEAGRAFYTEDYYRNYTKQCFDYYSRKNDILPRPKNGLELEKEFYIYQFEKETKNLQRSKTFFAKHKNEADLKLKDHLREYVLAYLDWLKNKLNENSLPGGPGLGSGNSGSGQLNQEELRTLLHEIVKSEIPDQSNQPSYEPPIKGIRQLAKFLGVGLNTAQNLKNAGIIPCFQNGRVVLFDPVKVREAMDTYNELNKQRHLRSKNK